MAQTNVKDLLSAGVHFGHLTRKWNPNMAPYIYMERNGIHIISLYKTVAKIEEASEAMKKIAASGRKILFVATKKQAKDIVAESAQKVKMPYITERWPGGMLTNFVTIRKAVKKMAAIDRMKKDGTFETLSKKEKLQVDRLRAKLEKKPRVNQRHDPIARCPFCRRHQKRTHCDQRSAKAKNPDFCYGRYEFGSQRSGFRDPCQ